MSKLDTYFQKLQSKLEQLGFIDFSKTEHYSHSFKFQHFHCCLSDMPDQSFFLVENQNFLKTGYCEKAVVVKYNDTFNSTDSTYQTTTKYAVLTRRCFLLLTFKTIKQKNKVRVIDEKDRLIHSETFDNEEEIFRYLDRVVIKL